MAVEYPPAFARDTVDGVKVVSDLVYESPLSRVRGRFVPIHGIRTLTLEDERVVYGCRDCDFIGVGPGKVRAHRRADHHFAEDGTPPKPPKRDGGVGQLRAPGPDALSMTLHELIDQASEVETYALAMESLDEENQELRQKLTTEKIEHREELSVLRREHREELAKARADQKAAEKALAAMKAKIAKSLGMTEDN